MAQSIAVPANPILHSSDGAPGSAAAASSSVAGVDAALQDLIRSQSTPGLQYLALDAAGVRYAAQVGLADVGQRRAVTARTTFHGYSVTKTFTAAALLQLALAGRVDLDAPIATYLPELVDPRSPTLRQVLAHTGGYANPIPLSWSHRSDDAAFDAGAFVRLIASQHGKVVRSPGTRFAYSNVGYLLLGEVIARCSGKPYAEYIESQILAPLKLGESESLSFSLAGLPSHARGYIRRFSLLNASLGLFIDRGKFLAGSYDGWSEFADLQVDGAAYGGLLGNAAGFGRYLLALLRAESPFPRELQDLLFAPQTTKDGKAIPMVLSWFRGQLDGHAYFDHAGGGGGYYCELRIYRDLGRASVLLCNRTGIKNDRLLDGIDRPLLRA